MQSGNWQIAKNFTLWLFNYAKLIQLKQGELTNANKQQTSLESEPRIVVCEWGKQREGGE